MHINETNGALPRIGTDVGAARLPSARVSAGDRPDFAAVYRAADDRSGSAIPETIPPAVLEDVERAGRLASALADRGQQIRFSTHDLSGRVVAHLCDQNGAEIRPVPLTELIPDPRGAR